MHAMPHTAPGKASQSCPCAQSLETVVMEAEKLLQQVNAETGEPSESITGFKATADGIEQQLIVFRQLLDISDPGQMKARPPASRMK